MCAQRPRLAPQAGIFALRLGKMKFLSRLKICPHRLIRNSSQHAEHRVVFDQNSANRRCSVNTQRLEFAQQEQTEYVVDIGISQQYACNRRLPQTLAWMQFRGGFDLSPQVRRSAQQKPHAVILRDRNLGLASRFAVERAVSHRAAICAAAIPLRKRASGRGTKNLYLHSPEFTVWHYCRKYFCENFGRQSSSSWRG